MSVDSPICARTIVISCGTSPAFAAILMDCDKKIESPNRWQILPSWITERRHAICLGAVIFGDILQFVAGRDDWIGPPPLGDPGKMLVHGALEAPGFGGPATALAFGLQGLFPAR